ncbi:hypothetical protein KIN20_035736 [Parelaphostrongylus tenuis]|uniref:Uncharacterized protein n=1 Tax=Parelaphostrongylus tenuis TaxID=148309 RepID=A0AAD5RBK7_PARTN|nr:hypothetical protein KIN20_035736 [Parelaphostrongylus tenuis]
MPSSDEDAPSVVFQRRSRKRKGSARTEVEGTQRTGPRVKPEEVSLSQEGQTSKIGRLTRHLIDATVNEKDGALKDVVTQKALYLSKKDYPSALKQASSALEKSFGCKVVHRSNQVLHCSYES